MRSDGTSSERGHAAGGHPGRARSTRLRRVRYVLLAASATLISTGGLAAVGVGPAAADVAPGQGSSYAQALQITPHEGSLAVGVVLGEALAGHTNTYARAQSLGLDLGAVGTSMKGYSCGQPPNATVAGAVPSPLIVEAGQPGASQGESESDPTKTYGSTEHGLANTTPYAEADTTFQPVDAAIFQVAGSATKAWSGIVDGQREAGATSDVASLSLGAGAVVLQGLHWSSVYPSSGSGKPTGSFSIGRAVIAGQSVPTSSIDQVQTAANQVLTNLGMELRLPQVTNSGGIESVSPLELLVVPNKNRDTIIDSILNGVAPVTNPVKTGLESGFGPPEPDQLQQALCKSETPITVADVALASISGAGYFNAAFGGVNSSSSELKANPFNLGLGGFGSLPGISQFVPGTPGTPGSFGTGADLGSAPQVSLPSASSAAGNGDSGGAPTVAQPTAATGFADGGPLLELGLAGLAAVLLLAEADRRMIRRTRVRAAFED